MSDHVVSVSSGLASAYLWDLVNSEHPGSVGVFADVNGEDKDNYRFLAQVEAHVGAPLVRLTNDGKTIWDVFRATRFLGNTRVDTCSRVLKREPIERWLSDNRDPAVTTLHIAVDWTEAHRIPAIRDGWATLGWTTAFWMADRFLDKNHALDWAERVGIEPTSLTREGWPHANCGGGCVRAGQGQFAALLLMRPESFAVWEAEEASFREWIGKDVAILRDRRNKETKPMPLSVLRDRVMKGEIKPDLGDGACNCMQPISNQGGSE